MKKNKFTYQISFEDVPHTQETVKAMLGGDYFNPDFPIDTHARESIFNLFQDARAFCFGMKMKEMVKKPVTDAEKLSQKRQLQYYDRKLKFYDLVESNLKLVSVE